MNTEPEQLVRAYIEAYNRFDLAGMLACLSEDIHFENITNGQTDLELFGKENFSAQAQQAAALFAERRQTIEHLTLTDDQAMAEIHFTGKIATDVPQGPKAGQIIDLKGKSLFTFRNGQIVHLQDIS